MFRNICSKIISKIKCLDFYGDFKAFKSDIYILDGEIVDKFMKIMPNFNIKITNFKY